MCEITTTGRGTRRAKEAKVSKKKQKKQKNNNDATSFLPRGIPILYQSSSRSYRTRNISAATTAVTEVKEKKFTSKSQSENPSRNETVARRVCCQTPCCRLETAPGRHLTVFPCQSLRRFWVVGLVFAGKPVTESLDREILVRRGSGNHRKERRGRLAKTRRHHRPKSKTKTSRVPPTTAREHGCRSEKCLLSSRSHRTTCHAAACTRGPVPPRGPGLDAVLRSPIVETTQHVAVDVSSRVGPGRTLGRRGLVHHVAQAHDTGGGRGAA